MTTLSLFLLSLGVFLAGLAKFIEVVFRRHRHRPDNKDLFQK